MGMTLPTPEFIVGMVGDTAVNYLGDVLWVQGLLNRWRKVKSLPLLGLDGGFGKRTEQAIVDFQKQELASTKPTGAIAPGDSTAARLLTMRPAFEVKPGPNFVMDADGVLLNKLLLGRVVRLSQCLIDTGLVSGSVRLNQGVRSPKVAHCWSTSWNIRKGRVSLAALKALKSGRDLDDNLWFDSDWERAVTKKAEKGPSVVDEKELWKKIHANALTYYNSNAIAAEGYPLTDARIKPNGHKAVSNHTGGRAIDASIPWKAGAKVFGSSIVTGATSEETANRIVRAFELSRPVKSERWHFQLPEDESRGFVSENNLMVGGAEDEAGPQSA